MGDGAHGAGFPFPSSHFHLTVMSTENSKVKMQAKKRKANLR